EECACPEDTRLIIRAVVCGHRPGAAARVSDHRRAHAASQARVVRLEIRQRSRRDEMKITRRWVLGACAGLAVVGLDAAAVNYASATGVQRLRDVHTGLPTPRSGAGRRGLVGCTVPLSATRPGCYCAGDSQDAADATWEAAVGRRARGAEKDKPAAGVRHTRR